MAVAVNEQIHMFIGSLADLEHVLYCIVWVEPNLQKDSLLFFVSHVAHRMETVALVLGH